jgi:hypothetical protein
MRIAALIVSIIVGYFIGHYLLAGAAAAYASVLISYHLYLIFLVVLAEHQKALSMTLGATIATHLAFVVFLIGFTYMRFHIPFFGLLRLFVPALAPFEMKWLFSGDGMMRRPAVAEAPLAAPVEVRDPTGEDYEAFQDYLRQQHRQFSKPGRSVAGEFEFWMADRVKKKV